MNKGDLISHVADRAGISKAAADKAMAAVIPEALRDWMRLRDEAGRRLCWVGDAYRESSLPQEVDDRFVARS